MPKYPAARYGRFKYGNTPSGKSVSRNEELAPLGQVSGLLSQLGAKPSGKASRYSSVKRPRQPLSDEQRKAIFAKQR